MSQKINQMLMPEFLTRFSCIGGECEDTCCSGWTVTVDKKSYKELRNQADKEKVTQEFLQHKFRPGDPQNSNAHMIINLEENGDCMFLDPDKLCKIQKRFGEGMLCNTCATYPRSFSGVNEYLEVSATLSCPEIARLALLSPEPMRASVTKLEGERKPNFGHLATQNHMPGSFHHFFVDIRDHLFEILEDRSYTIEQRLMLLGMFCRSLGEADLQGDISTRVADVIEHSRQLLQDSAVHTQLAEMNVVLGVQLQLVHQFLSRKPQMSARFQAVWEKVRSVFGDLEAQTAAEATERYAQILDGPYRAAIQGKEHVLEHYVVNTIFKDSFLLYESPFAYYVNLVTRFTVLRFLLCAVAAHDGALTDETIVYTVQSFSRFLEHNKFFQQLYEDMKREGLNTLAYMTVLLSI